IIENSIESQKILWVGDDTPDTLHSAQFCIETFPNARFVHLARDGRDALAACWYQENQRSPPIVQELCKTVEEFAPRYAEAWCHVCRTAQQFGAENPDRFLELRYEDLFTRPVDMLRQAFALFELVVGEDEIVEYCRRAGLGERDGRWARDPGTDPELELLGRPGVWRDALPAAAADAFMEVAGDELNTHGYG
ncbi:MAG: sulfotransferase, partial [Proteobacteria bacterium]|nr:sulfotransferase [Pseudomonadota bacterium]